MNLKSARPVFYILTLIMLTACASGGGRLQKAGSSADAFGMDIRTDLNWSRIKMSRQELWTIDGPTLNSFSIIPDTKPGEHVLHLAREGKSHPDGPWFRAGMRPDELREVILDALRGQGWSNVTSGNFRPHDFSGFPGIRFDLRQTNPDGLIYQGTVGAFVRDERLTVLYWRAPQEHYYGRDVHAVNAMIDGVRLLPVKP